MYPAYANESLEIPRAYERVDKTLLDGGTHERAPPAYVSGLFKRFV